MATGEKFQWSFSSPSSTELQHLNMAYIYVNGDGKLRDLRVTFELFCRQIFIVLSVNLNTPIIDKYILSRAN